MSLEHKLLEQGIRKLSIREHLIRGLNEHNENGRITDEQLVREVKLVEQKFALSQPEHEAVSAHFRKNVRQVQYA